MFEMISLPYPQDALDPYISATTMEYHYGKHYKTYVENLNKLVADTEYEDMALEDVVKQTAGKAELQAIFNNAGQAWNHAFFWNSMQPNGGGAPKGKLAEMIDEQFGSFDKFREAFKNAAVSQFGSGWAWLAENDGKLEVLKTANADTPLAHGLKPLITLDVWEHAYYLDYQNRRADFVDQFLDHLVNWPQIS